jgi:hypothetical protein
LLFWISPWLVVALVCIGLFVEIASVVIAIYEGWKEL